MDTLYKCFEKWSGSVAGACETNQTNQPTNQAINQSTNCQEKLLELKWYSIFDQYPFKHFSLQKKKKLVGCLNPCENISQIGSFLQVGVKIPKNEATT